MSTQIIRLNAKHMMTILMKIIKMINKINKIIILKWKCLLRRLKLFYFFYYYFFILNKKLIGKPNFNEESHK